MDSVDGDNEYYDIAIFTSDGLDENILFTFAKDKITFRQFKNAEREPFERDFVRNLMEISNIRILVVDGKFGLDDYKLILKNKGSTCKNTFLITVNDSSPEESTQKNFEKKVFDCVNIQFHDEITGKIEEYFHSYIEGVQGPKIEEKTTATKIPTPEKVVPKKKVQKSSEPETEVEQELDQSKTLSSSPVDKTSQFGVLFGLVALMVALIWSQQEVVLEDMAPPEISMLEKYVEKIDAMKNQTEQPDKFWKVVRSLRYQINDTNPQQPAVLMLVSMKKASTSREFLAKEIAKAYSVRCSDADPVMVSGGDYAGMDDDDAKEKIDKKIFAGFNAQSCATVVSNFEKLPPASTKVFYQFCENDMAPFKKAAVIFTLEIKDGPWDEDDNVSEDGIPRTRKWNEIVDNFIHYTLRTRDTTDSMTRDMIAPLISRITPAVAWVQ